jgi:putative tryptophan/tyrosine transport system substrate-binding protein
MGADYPIVKSPVSFASTGQQMVLGQMQRRQFITLLGCAAVAPSLLWPLAARAQQGDRVRRVGVLMGIADDFEGQARVAAFRQALHALGWTEGRNVQFIYRWSAGDPLQARRFANELIELRSDVILANSTPIALAVRDTTRTTPTVFVQVSDPVTAGVVHSLARPGGNLTGFTNFEPSMASKWLELVKGVAPNIARVAYLFNPHTAAPFYASAVESAAPLLAVKPVAAAVRDAAEMERAIEQFARESDGALLVLPDLFTATNRRSIVALAARHRLPAVYPFRYFVASGGLMSYGIEVLETYRQAAAYIDRILKGERPGDLPVQQPTKFEFVINLKTANALGLDMPEKLLATAHEVIE